MSIQESLLELRCQIGDLVAGHRAKQCEEALDYAIECIKTAEGLPSIEKIHEIIDNNLPTQRKWEYEDVLIAATEIHKTFGG